MPYPEIMIHGMRQELSQLGIEKSLGETVPLSRTMVEEIARLRDWAKLRTRKASA